MLPEHFAIVGAIIGSLGGIYYLFETVVGKAFESTAFVAYLCIFNGALAFLASRVHKSGGRRVS